MADGTRRVIAEVRPGDAIYGTVRQGEDRRFVKTHVLAHWETQRRAYRVTLADGTGVVASGDHRFLTDQGWTFVAAAEPGRNQRPWLTLGSELMGTDAVLWERDIEGMAVTTRAQRRVVAIDPLAADQTLVDITTGTGDFIANGLVSHNCYARRTHWFLDQDGVKDWGSRIFVKVNAPEVLRQELARSSWTHEEVHIGTATDPYQPAEGTYRLTRQILEALRDYQTAVTIVTRSSMVVRDRDILRQLAGGPGALVCFSIATMDSVLAREIEPDVPPPQRRLEALRILRQAGIPAGVFLAPVLPGITDRPEQLAAVVEAATASGASSLWTNALHLGDITRQAFFEYLEHRRPELVPQYAELYKGKYAPSEYRRRLQEVVAALKAHCRAHAVPAGAQESAQRRPARVPEQLSLL